MSQSSEESKKPAQASSQSLATDHATTDTHTKTESSKKEPVEYGGFWRRFAAMTYDSIFAAFIGAFIGGTLGAAGLQELAGISGLVVGVAYVLGFWMYNDAQTPGKLFLKLKIVPEEGGKLTWPKAIIRYVGYWISGIVLYLGYIWAAFDGKKQGWHDKIARTYVISTGKPNGFVYGLGIFLGILGPILIIIGIIALFIFIGAFASSGKGANFMNLISNQDVQTTFFGAIECGEECEGERDEDECVQMCIQEKMEEEGISPDDLQDAVNESGLFEDEDMMYDETGGTEEPLSEDELQELEQQFEEQFGEDLNLDMDGEMEEDSEQSDLDLNTFEVQEEKQN